MSVKSFGIRHSGMVTNRQMEKFHEMMRDAGITEDMLRLIMAKGYLSDFIEAMKEGLPDRLSFRESIGLEILPLNTVIKVQYVDAGKPRTVMDMIGDCGLGWRNSEYCEEAFPISNNPFKCERSFEIRARKFKWPTSLKEAFNETECLNQVDPFEFAKIEHLTALVKTLGAKLPKGRYVAPGSPVKVMGLVQIPVVHITGGDFGLDLEIHNRCMVPGYTLLCVRERLPIIAA